MIYQSQRKNLCCKRSIKSSNANDKSSAALYGGLFFVFGVIGDFKNSLFLRMKLYLVQM